MEIIKYIGDVNILLVVLDILFLIISFLFFDKKKYNTRVKDIFVIFYTLINLFLFSYLNSLFQNIFTLKYLSVKSYLILILITLSIFLYTFNRVKNIVYKIITYLYSTLINIILIVNIYVVLSDKLKFYEIMDISNSIVLMNISYIIFFGYLVVVSLIYIGYCLYNKYGTKKEVNVISKKTKKEKKFKKINFKLKKEKIVKTTTDDNNDIEVNINNNTLDDLFKYRVGDSFYINGVDCSIIFCDSNKNNIIKNYEILSSDIGAKLVNGYTLDENIMIKNICNKLKISNLGGVDINNLSILNIISIEEYNFLVKLFSID